MPIIPVREVGRVGIVQDTPSVLLPPTAWSDGLDVKFDNSSVSKRGGYVQILPDLTGATNPHFGIHWPRPGTRYNIYANSTTVSRVDEAGNISNISTGSTYSSGARWHGSLFTGGYAVVMNNTVDVPQYILYGTTGATTETTLTDLPGWNYGSTTVTAGVVRPFRNVLVAGNLTDTSGGVVTPRPSTIRVSTRAAAGGIPQTWEPGALGNTATADEFELSQTEAIVEMGELRGRMVIYTGDSIHSLNVTSTSSNVADLHYGNGCLAIGCVGEFDGQHLVVDRNDIYIHSGSGGIQSAVDGKLRDFFFTNLNKEHAANTFVVRNGPQDEMWICYPNLSANANGDCNAALVYNYRQKTWTKYTLPNGQSAFQGPMVRNDEFLEAEEKLVFVSTADNRFYAMDEGNTFNGTNFPAYVERINMDMGDLEATKWNSSIYPLVDGEGTLTVRAAAGNSFGAVDFSARNVYSGNFTIGDDYKLDTRINGRFVSFRFESTDANSWRLAGYSLNAETEDRR